MAQFDSYFQTVPDEIKIKIFSYLKTSDIISVCTAFPQLVYILCDQTILRLNGLNFSKSYLTTVNDLKNISSFKSELVTVTTLNIAGLYWIPASNLVTFIKKLPNLLNLFAVGTKLNFSTFLDCGLTKIRRVALTNISGAREIFNKRTIERCSNSLRFVLIHTDRTKNTRFLELRDILFCITHDFINSHHFLYILNYVKTETKEIFSERSNLKINFTIGRDPGSDYSASNTEWNWKNLLMLENNYPFGIRDIKAIANKTFDTGVVQLVEIDLCHKNSIEEDDFEQCKYFMTQIMLSNNVKFLRKLALNFCCIDNDHPPAKKRKLNNSTDDSESTVLEIFVYNCPLLNELEIWKCDCHTEKNDQSALNNIANFKKLKKLTLVNVPLNIPNKLLLKIIDGCKYLEHLNVKSDKLNATLNTSMYLSIPFASSLKDLRYEQTYVSLDRLFESLNKIENCQLQRLHIKCSSIERFQVKDFETFLQHCKHLIFLLLEIESLPLSVHKDIQKSMNEHKKNPQQVFYSTKDATSKIIPSVHLLELVEIKKNVSVLNFFEDCDTLI